MLTENYRTKKLPSIRFHGLSGKTSNTLPDGKLTHIVRVAIASVRGKKNRAINGDKSRRDDAAGANDATRIFRHDDA